MQITRTSGINFKANNVIIQGTLEQMQELDKCLWDASIGINESSAVEIPDVSYPASEHLYESESVQWMKKNEIKKIPIPRKYFDFAVSPLNPNQGNDSFLLSVSGAHDCLSDGPELSMFTPSKQEALLKAQRLGKKGIMQEILDRHNELMQKCERIQASAVIESIKKGCFDFYDMKCRGFSFIRKPL